MTVIKKTLSLCVFCVSAYLYFFLWHFLYGRYAVWYSSRRDFCQRRHVVFSCGCVLEALVLNVRLWRILKFLVHFEGDGVDMCFFYFDVREKKSNFAFNIYKENFVYYCFKIKTVHYEGLL